MSKTTGFLAIAFAVNIPEAGVPDPEPKLIIFCSAPLEVWWSSGQGPGFESQPGPPHSVF